MNVKHLIQLEVEFIPVSVAHPSPAADLLDAESTPRGNSTPAFQPRALVDGNYTKRDQPNAPYTAAVRRHSVSTTITLTIFDAARIAD
ncbi:hypothetical protein BBJ41_29035 [Burkholderia stabilis]|uniref:hypothetical protein n=1 Tax=Burkholderia stabilis TaxID=95485 RepID=UPI0008516E24|nr:hypothetical protein [Burkholderia stabilis]AOR71509.1 hypothetical protein BBJ41_29035 [Burkholderia stabilis]HDR9490365.1 hypothetical protein [Burkholderia stabilis]HDR9521452.1 hypothetical protein [Burkholderia stabilis]HDR9531966.1 hypothetical protein [Burkholderia stabilis]HDR9537470.1 hypothetical protein [Burkholderia stabilis]